MMSQRSELNLTPTPAGGSVVPQRDASTSKALRVCVFCALLCVYLCLVCVLSVCVVCAQFIIC